MVKMSKEYPIETQKIMGEGEINLLFNVFKL
jgi:hypothetical protein